MTIATELAVPADLPAAHAVVPLWLKLAYSLFMLALVPVYWHHYGPSNFLYFCDTALFLALAGIWLENPLSVSMPAVGILAPQVLWVADFLLNLVGLHLTGMTDYMFEPARPLYLRGLSLFHGWLPFLLVYLVWRLGYDRRAFIAWTLLAWALVLTCYFFMPPPGPAHGIAPVNINYVYGMSDTAPQSWMPASVWLSLELVLLPLVLYAPVHWLLRRYAPAA
ncbi:MAG TPA: hypothetical protein VM074_11965 [Solimonas sp.]|nr:hypothetical protein [Solimonas sp.]